MTREEAVTVLKAFMENPLFSDAHKQAFNIAIHDIKEVADVCEFEASKYDMTDAYESHVACQEGKCAEEHRQLAEWLKELKQLRKQTRWIPASKKLPEEKGPYWVTVKVKYEEGLEVLYSEQREWLGQRWGELSCAHCGVDTIIAWMPLPAPFESQERSGEE